MKIIETVMEQNGNFCGYRIPLVSYEYEEPEKLNKDLVFIVDEIEEFYLNVKADSIKNDSDGGTNTKSILTHNYWKFNILDRTEYNSIKKFKKFIGDSYQHYIKTYTPFKFEDVSKDIYAQCWGNKLGKFDYLDKHTHTSTVFTPHLYSMPMEISANYFIKSPGHDTYTRFYSPVILNKQDYVPIKNKEGHLTIFPSFVEHDTTPNRDPDNYRYTLGMDAINPNPEQVESVMAHSTYVKLYEDEK